MDTVRLVAAGDVWLQTKYGRHPFAQVRKILADKDILFANLETALSMEGERAEKHHVIAAPPENAAYLKEAGFDIVSVANNHTLDMGATGFANTLDALAARGIASTGGSTPRHPSAHAVLERSGIQIGFLGYTIGRSVPPPGTVVNRLVEEKIVADIRALRESCDHVAVSLHWGVELVYYPSPWQIRLAHRLVDAGATLILGHHPHTIQAVERYRGGLIAYSLGMLQFDPNWPHGISHDSFVLSIDIGGDGVASVRAIPIIVDDDFVPSPAGPDDAQRILRFVSDVSGPVNEGRISSRWWFEQIAEPYMTMNLESYQLRIRQHGVLPLLECGVWLATPFCMRCYAGLLRKRLRRANGAQ
ncbi:CapA family protein [Methanoculleus sp. FWC-SCC1]|uniref:CapA family protein n=1 Tax=Methanoculleus frigidifontis TaxID=2584085 RepID=A0ABT8MDT1_9EURY|nr:CapA family protein [Methanoculleus sp. FWC-SCC1]MDN7026091.1 CapA family protein [Methanoculleus sp. FWC-SCC1]